MYKIKHDFAGWLLTVIFATGVLTSTLAQTLTPRVICSGYGSGQGGGIKLNYTIGETFVTTLRSGNTVLTQGFHQPEVNACPSAPLVANLPENITLSCEDSILSFDPGFYMTDGSAVTVTQTDSVTSYGCITIYLQEWIGVNECNDSTVVSRLITLVDEQAPFFVSVPSDLTIACTDPIPTVELPLVSDNCDAQVAITTEDVTVADGYSGGYRIDRIFYATDECGNQSVDTQYIHVNVSDTPVFDANNSASFTYSCDESIPVVTPTLAYSSDPVIAAADSFNNATTLFTNTNGTGTYYSGSSAAGDRPGSSPFVVDGSHSFGKNNGNVSITSSNINTQGLLAPQMSFRLAAFSIGSTTNGLDASDIVTVEVSTNGGATYQSTARVLGFSNAFWGFNTGTGNASTPYDGNATPVNFQPAGGGARTTDGFSTVTITDLPATDALRVRISMVTNSLNERWIIDNFKVTGIVNTFGEVTLAYTDSITDSNCQKDILRQWTASNECGNASTFVQRISVLDTEAPVIDFVAEIDRPCEDAAGIYATATDNCDNDVQVVWVSDDLASGACAGRIVRTYSATDDCGNTVSVQQIITLIDTSAPFAINQPENITVECGSAIPTFDPSWVDNCSNEITATVNEFSVPSGCNTIITETYTAADVCGNSASVTRVVTIIDTTNPTIVGLPENVTIDCDDALPAVAEVSAFDNCDNDVTIASEDVIVPGNCAGSYLVERVYRATDNCGNQAIATQNIYVVDSTAPIFNADNESTFVYECDEFVPVTTPVAVDDCSGVNLQFVDNVSGNVCNTYISREWTATDGCGNSSTFVQNITIADTEGPVFAGDIEIERSCDDAQGIYVTATDNCTANVEVIWIVDEQTQSRSCAGEIVRTYGATDACGNYSEFVQIIQLVDNIAPVCSNVPAPLTIDCGVTVPVYFPLWSDNCDVELDLAENTTFAQNGCVATLTIVYTATDNCGNVGTVTRVVNGVDTTAPVASNVPANQSIECSSFNGGMGIGEPTFTDNCNSLTLTENVTEEIVDCDHVYTYVWTATDECGNATSVSTTITVFDLSNPVFEDVPFGGTFNCDGGINFGEATAFDACGDAVVTFNDNIVGGNCPQTYTIVRTWTATDDCGNTASATTLYNVVDNVAPVFTEFSGDASIECGATELPVGVASATDNCDTDIEITYIDVLVAQDNCQRAYERRFTAVDDCGNTTIQVQMIYVNDTTPPVISGDATVTVSCDEFSSTGVYVSAADVCGDAFIVILYDEPSSEGCANSVIRHYAASDECNNASYFNQTIVVVDEEAPTASADPADMTYGCNDSWSPAVITFTDNCAGEVIVNAMTEETGDACNMVYHYMWVATDACGNTTVVDQYITVVDETAPVFNVESVTFNAECGAEVSLPAVSATDNCGSEVIITSSESIVPGNCANNYTAVTTYTASDVCGNNASISFTVNYNDTTAPVWSSDNAASFTYECDQTAEVVQPFATDACSAVDYVYTDGPVNSNGCTGSFVRSWIASDACGNASAEFNQTITFEDTTEPVLVGCPGDLILACDAEVPAPAEVTAIDNCDSDVIVTMVETCINCPADGSTSSDLFTPVRPAANPCNYPYDWAMALFSLPSIHRWYQIDPTTTSSINYNNDGTVSLSGRVFNVLSPNGGFDFNVILGDAKNWTEWSSDDIPSGFKADCGAIDSNFTQWMYYIIQPGGAVDLTGWGSYAGSSLNITHAPSNRYFAFQIGEGANNYNADYGGGNWFIYSGTLLHNGLPIGSSVGGNGTLTFRIASCPEYSIIRTWTAIDCAGNTTSCSQTIQFDDITPPVFTNCPDAVYVQCGSEIPAPIPANSILANDENYGPTAVSYVGENINQVTPCNYEITYTYSATDNSGNTSYCSYTIYVNDSTAPSIAAPASYTVECNNEVVFSQALATDNCSGFISLLEAVDTLYTGCSITYTRYFTAIDACGNTAHAEQVIQVIDMTAPILNLPFDYTVECNEEVFFENASATDNCTSNLSIAVNIDTISVYNCQFTYVRTFSVSDDCGNTTIGTQVIQVVDTTSPIININTEIERPCDDYSGIYATAADNCDSSVDLVLVADEFVAGSCAGLIVRTYSATDDCGNTVSVQQIITLIDTTAPIFEPQASIEQFNCASEVPLRTPAVSDNCSSFDLQHSDAIVSVEGELQLQRTWTATDACGNQSTWVEFFLLTLGEPGMSCDDGNPCTINDTVDENCTCQGTPVETAVSVEVIQACEPYTWNGQTYTVSGNYSFNTQTVLGCDSLARLALTVGTPTFSSQSVTNCGSYTWNGTNYSQSGTYTYVTTNSTGCPNTATLNLTVNNPSIAPSSVSASANNVSAGTSVTLTVQGGSLGTGASWKWYRGSCGGTLVGTGAIITITANVTDTYYVRAEGTCNTTTCTTITVNVLSAQCGPEVVSASSTRICSGSSTTLSVLGTLYPGAIWRWRRNSCSGTIVGTGANLLVSPTATTTYYVRAEGGTCGITLCMEITIIVDKMPSTPSVISGPASGLCNAQNVTYSVTPVSTVQQYNWTLPPGVTLVSGQGTSSIIVNFSNFIGTNSTNGNPAICVTAQNSCGISPIRCLSLTTYPATPAFISGTATPCINTVNTYSCPTVYGATSYSWTVPTGWVIQSGQGTSSISVLCNGTSGNVRVRSINACGNSTFRTLACTPAVCGTTAMPMQLELWPNPTSDRVFMAHGDAIPTHMQIYDMLGRDIYNGPWVPEYDVSSLAGGIYFVRATGGGESVVKRLEVVR